MKAPSRSATDAYYRKKGEALYIQTDFEDIFAAYRPGFAVIYHLVSDVIYPQDRLEKYHHFGLACSDSQTPKALYNRLTRYVSALRGSGNSYAELQEPHLLGKAKEVYLTAELLELVDPLVGKPGMKKIEDEHGRTGKLEYGDWCLTNHEVRRNLKVTTRGI
jgi:hypothetical protein